MKITKILTAVLIVSMFFGCAKQEEEISQKIEEREEETMIRLFLNEQEVEVNWAENQATEALKEKLKDGDVRIAMSMYGGFEQVGSLGFSLPAQDTRITTNAGDIVLYSSDQIVIFYGSNTWSYTKLGQIKDRTNEELEEMLGKGDIEVRLSLE